MSEQTHNRLELEAIKLVNEKIIQTDPNLPALINLGLDWEAEPPTTPLVEQGLDPSQSETILNDLMQMDQRKLEDAVAEFAPTIQELRELKPPERRKRMAAAIVSAIESLEL
jgi:hypothetical protein